MDRGGGMGHIVWPRWEWWTGLPHWVQAELGQGLEAGFDFCLVVGHMEAQGEKKRKRECLCLSPLRLEYHPAYSDR